MARPANFQTIYLDSAAFLNVILGEAGNQHIAYVLSLADQGKVQIFASPLILVETRGQGKGASDPQVENHAQKVLGGARIIDVELTHSVALRARDYVGKHGLKPADAIHLASAVEAAVDLFWSPDGDFRRLRGTKVEGVWVDEPYPLQPPTLFDAD